MVSRILQVNTETESVQATVIRIASQFPHNYSLSRTFSHVLLPKLELSLRKTNL